MVFRCMTAGYGYLSVAVIRVLAFWYRRGWYGDKNNNKEERRGACTVRACLRSRSYSETTEWIASTGAVPGAPGDFGLWKLIVHMKLQFEPGKLYFSKFERQQKKKQSTRCLLCRSSALRWSFLLPAGRLAAARRTMTATSTGSATSGETKAAASVYQNGLAARAASST